MRQPIPIPVLIIVNPMRELSDSHGANIACLAAHEGLCPIVMHPNYHAWFGVSTSQCGERLVQMVASNNGLVWILKDPEDPNQGWPRWARGIQLAWERYGGRHVARAGTLEQWADRLSKCSRWPSNKAPQAGGG